MVNGNQHSRSYERSRWLMTIIVIIWVAFTARLFYMQVIRHDYYATLASSVQERRFEIPAQRGEIYGLDRNGQAPLVLNENLPTVYADPRFIEDPSATADQLAAMMGGSADELTQLMSDKTRSYVVLRKKVAINIADQVRNQRLTGIGVQDSFYRSYPEGTLAAQILGFVNIDQLGQYGVEQYLDETLQGTPGRVEAVTDVNGTPLRSEDQNILADPVAGDDLTLTIDVNLQRYVEDAVREMAVNTSAKYATAIVMDPYSGAVKAMANHPSFDPRDYASVSDFSLFINGAVAAAYEPGSVMKTATMAAGLNEGAVSRQTTYYDTGYVQVDDRLIQNAVPTVPFNRSMDSVIERSANTGAVFVLKQLGGGEINLQGRSKLYEYLTQHFGFGQLTGIAQSYEAAGRVYGPEEGGGVNVRYANMTFGQGLTVTPLQLAAAFSSIINGGTYYKPYLIDSVIDNLSNQTITTVPLALRTDVVSEQTAADMRAMLRLVVGSGGGQGAALGSYIVGGKTGTAQVLDENGNYSMDRTIGSFIGYLEGADGIEYVILTRVDEPQIPGYSSTVAAVPLFRQIAQWLVNYERIPPI